MHEQVEVVYENGVLRPLGPLPGQIRENQHLTVTIDATEDRDWLSDADASISLDAVRSALGKISGTLAQTVINERADR